MTSNRALVLCETPADVRAAPAVLAEEAQATVVVLSPAAWLEAQHRGVPAAILEHFYSENELSELRYPLLDRQLAWMDWLDRTLCEAVPELTELNLKPSRLWFYCLKRLIDPLIVLSFTLDQLLERTASSRVWLPRQHNHEMEWTHFFRAGPHGRMETPRFSPSDVAPLLATARDIEVRYLASKSVPASSAAAPLSTRGIRPFLRNRVPAWLIDKGRLAHRLHPRDVLRAMTSLGRASGARLLVVRGGYDLDPLIRECVRRGAKPEFWSSLEGDVERGGSQPELFRALVDRCACAWPQIGACDELRTPFRATGVDLFHLVRDGLQYFVTQAIPDAVSLYLRGRRAIRSRGHRVLLAPAGIRAVALLEAARAERVPVVIYQHGGFVSACDHVMWDLTDFGNADTFIVYGEGTRRYFEKRRDRMPQPGATLRVAGSARLEQRLHALKPAHIRKARSRLVAGGKEPVVLYASTFTTQYSRLVAAESYPETSCFVRQVAAIEVMKGCPDVTFVFKPYSDRDNGLLRQAIARSGASNCRIVSDIPLLTLMWAADAILVEFPSTALLEAAMTRKPIVAYIDRESLRLEPEACAALKRRVTLAESHDGFLKAIRELVRDGRFGDQTDLDDLYARDFVLDASGHRAVHRAWDVVHQAASA